METENKGIMQGIAGSIEITLRAEFGIKERGGLGGIIDADSIRAYMGAFYYCMAMALLKHYSETNSSMVDKFIEEIDDIKELKMDEIINKRAQQIEEAFRKVYDKVEKQAKG